MERKGQKPSVGVIGLGIIGSRVTANLRKAGWQVCVWNRSPRPEPNFLSSAEEVAESAKFIQIFVTTGAALLEVVRNMAPALTPEHVILNHSTVSPQESIEAAAIVQDRHASFLDAPFTGSRDAAAEGKLVFYIGGDTATLNRVRPLLEVNAKEILEIGEIGQASVVKIATNLITAATVQALSESLCLLDRSGISPQKLQLALAGNLARSGVSDAKIPAMLSGDFEPRFSLRNMFKDVQYALKIGTEYGVDMPAASAFAGSAMAGLHNGWSEQDFSVISRHYGFPATAGESPEAFPTPVNGIMPDDPSSAEPPKRKGIFGIFGGKK